MIPQLNLPDFLAVDFYCGAGGTTRGLIDAGGYVIAGIDKDAACRATYQRNNRNRFLDRAEPEFIRKDMFPRSAEYPDGEQDEIRDELRELVARRRSQCDNGPPLLFAVCAPCQSFTKFVQPNMTAERTAGRERDRNLLDQAVELIREFGPDMVLSENVAGIECGVHGPVWKNFQNELRGLGYRVGAAEVNASRFAVPQRRRRAIIMAAKTKTARLERASMDLPVPPGSDNKPPTIKETIGKLPPLLAGGRDENTPNHQCRNLSDINRRRLQAVAPGEPNFGFSDELALPCHRRLDVKGKRGFGDVYTRVHPDRPAPTITTRFHSVSNGRFGHYEQDRGLSLHEGALLQSFPPDYEFHAEGMDTAARMIGNAVPPKLAEHLARHLYDVWREEQFLPADATRGDPR